MVCLFHQHRYESWKIYRRDLSLLQLKPLFCTCCALWAFTKVLFGKITFCTQSKIFSKIPKTNKQSIYKSCSICRIFLEYLANSVLITHKMPLNVWRRFLKGRPVFLGGNNSLTFSHCSSLTSRIFITVDIITLYDLFNTL